MEEKGGDIMHRYYYPFNGNRYIGNANTMEVHDSDNEQDNCQINEIKTEHVRTFYPDTLYQAHSQGYDNCAYCIGNSMH